MKQLIDQHLNQYKIISLHSEGGLGYLYEAINIETDQFVTCKVIRPALTVEAEFEAEFNSQLAEIKALDHPHILPVLDYGHSENFYYLIYPQHSGRSLRQLIEENRKGIPLSDSFIFFLPLVEALMHAHEKGVLHRNIKPENILIKKTKGTTLPLLLDFGLVDLAHQSTDVTRSRVRIGTPAYMSPEQCRSQPLNEASDVYSLGVVLFEMISGQPPYPIRNLIDAVRFHQRGRLMSLRALIPSVPIQINALVRRMLATAPERRPLLADLRNQLAPQTNILTSPAVPTLPVPDIMQTSSLILTGATPNLQQETTAAVESYDLDLLHIFISKESQPLPLTYKLGNLMTVGRLDTAYISLPNNSISKEHCQIKRKGNKLLLRDLNSTNGTYLDNTKLAPHTWYDWNPSNVVRLGYFTMHLKLADANAVIELENQEKVPATVAASVPILVCADGQPQRVPLSSEPIIIGRAATNHMVLVHRYVSKQHCQIWWEDGRLLVQDLGSTNGTFYRDERLPANKPFEWDPAFPLNAGPFVIQVEI